MKFLRFSMMLAALSGLLAGTAIAKEPKLLLPMGMSAQIGGGVFGFVDPDAVDATDPGGSWTARLLLGTRSHIAAEAARNSTRYAASKGDSRTSRVTSALKDRT